MSLVRDPIYQQLNQALRELIASGKFKAGDKVAVKSRKRSMDLVKLNQQQAQPVPDFLEITGSEPPEGQVRRLPTRGDVDPRLNKDVELQEQLIIEFCAR